MVKTESTEQKILNAAREVFVRKGLTGARMQEIANEAGINKALLHYYFRSKEKLFDRIFLEAFKTISAGVGQVFIMELSLTEKLRKFIDLYVDVLLANPYLPAFVLGELHQNPERLQKIVEKDIWGVMQTFIMQLMQEMNSGKIKTIHPAHLMLNIIGLLVFPFVAKPLVSPMLKSQMGIDYDDILQQRKDEVYNFVLSALKPD